MNTVTSRFGTRQDADRAVDSLRRAGFDEDEITISCVDEEDEVALELSGETLGARLRRLVPLFGGLGGAVAGAIAMPYALGAPPSLDPSSAGFAALCTGACVLGACGAQLAAAFTRDASLPRERGAGTRLLIGVRTLDGFAGRARRILTKSGGAHVETQAL